jgi:hypothetical protein
MQIILFTTSTRQLSNYGYSEKEMASFFLCDDNWRREKEITLVEMNTDFDEDSYIMKVVCCPIFGRRKTKNYVRLRLYE